MDINDLFVPTIKKGQKIGGKIINSLNKWMVVNCENGSFLWIILPKEIKNLERNGVDLSNWTEIEAEILDPRVLTDKEWYYIISISKLLQYNVWDDFMKKKSEDQIIEVIPTEANFGWLLIDIYGIKWFLPLSQLAPVHYPRVEDGDQEKIFQHLLSLIWEKFKVRIINFEDDNKRMILSEREALKEEREKIMKDLKVWNIYDGTISWLSSYGIFVTIWWGLEWLVHISEITYGHVDNFERYGNVKEKVQVKIIGFEEGKISFSMKKLKEDPWDVIPKKFKIWDVVEWEVVRYVTYGVFIRLHEDINWLIHLSELSDKPVSNPMEVLKLGQKVKAKIILIDQKQRKAWLTIRWLHSNVPRSRKPWQRRFWNNSNYNIVKSKTEGTADKNAEKKHVEKKPTEKVVAKKTDENTKSDLKKAA